MKIIYKSKDGIRVFSNVNKFAVYNLEKLREFLLEELEYYMRLSSNTYGDNIVITNFTKDTITRNIGELISILVGVDRDIFFGYKYAIRIYSDHSFLLRLKKLDTERLTTQNISKLKLLVLDEENGIEKIEFDEKFDKNDNSNS